MQKMLDLLNIYTLIAKIFNVFAAKFLYEIFVNNLLTVICFCLLSFKIEFIEISLFTKKLTYNMHINLVS